MNQNDQVEGLQGAQELCVNAGRRARELRDKGKRIIGYFCCQTPVEFITALGFVPYRIRGNPRKQITRANEYVETNICPYVRSCFDLALKGDLDFIEGLVVPHSCDYVSRIYDIWRLTLNPRFAHFINVPHMINAASKSFFENELRRFQQKLEVLAGVELTSSRLSDAISVHNQSRALVRRLYELRKEVPPLISGVEMTEVLLAGMEMPAVEFNRFLEGIIAQVTSRQARPPSQSVRVLIYGAEMDDPDFIQLVEDCGSNIVMDDSCTGSRGFWHDVDSSGDLFTGLTSHYLEAIPCPRTYKENPGSHRADMDNRFKYLKKFVEEYRVNAAILHVLRYCDTHALDAPDVRDYLQDLGIPVYHIERDYQLGDKEQLRNRIQAFFESKWGMDSIVTV